MKGYYEYILSSRKEALDWQIDLLVRVRSETKQANKWTAGA